jgi:hypothetical protein
MKTEKKKTRKPLPDCGEWEDVFTSPFSQSDVYLYTFVSGSRTGARAHIFLQ